MTHREDPIRCYHSGPEWTWEQWQWRDTLHFSKLQHYWNLTIRLLSVISMTLVVGGVLPHCRNPVGVFYSLSQLDPKLIGRTRSYPSAKMKLVYSIAPANWANICKGLVPKVKYYSHHDVIWHLLVSEFTRWVMLVGWLVGFCRLFNAESIFIWIISFLSNNSV